MKRIKYGESRRDLDEADACWQGRVPGSASLPTLVTVLVFEGSSYRPIGDSAHLQVSTYASHSDSFNHDKSVLLPTGHSKNLAQSRDIDLLLRSDWQISMLTHPPNGISCQLSVPQMC